MNIYDLLSLKSCADAYRFSKLFKRPKNMHIELIDSVVDYIFKSRKDGAAMEEVRDGIVRMCDSLPEEVFDFPAQRVCAIEKDVALLTRLADHLYDGYTVIATKCSEEAALGIEYRGYKIPTITVRATALVEKDGVTRAINVHVTGENPYSSRARKELNLPMYSPYLATMYLAFANRFDGLQCESWYLRSKDDRAGRYAATFDSRPGANSVSAAYPSMAAAFSALEKCLYDPDAKADCDTCRYSSACMFSGEVLMNPAKNAVVGTPAKKPVFSDAQKQVVEHLNGPMCVIAVPGAGKTFSLANRLVEMLRNGISPKDILFVTFSKKAAGEIVERVMGLLDTDDRSAIPDVFTFHALGYTILRENPTFVGKRVKLADVTDRLAMIKEALRVSPQIKNMSYDENALYLDYGIIRTLDRYFADIEKNGKDAFVGQYAEKRDCDGIFAVYDKYIEMFEAQCFIDFDQQILLVNELFSKYPSLVKKYSERYRYIMVDEYQDTDAAQAQMIYALAKTHNNIVVVGDDDQSIYRWRGGSSSFMKNFKDDFPSAKLVFMNDNYRSNDRVIESANVLMAHESDRFDKTLVAHKTASNKPVYWHNANLDTVFKLVLSAINRGNALGDIAILARSNKRLGEVSEMLASHGIKYSSPKDYMIEDSVFLILRDVMDMFYNGIASNDEAFYRYLVSQGIDAGTIHKRNFSLSLYDDMVKEGVFPVVNHMEAGALEALETSRNISKEYEAAYRLLAVFKEIQYSRGIKDTLRNIASVLFEIETHPVIDVLLDKADEKAIVSVRPLFEVMNNMVLYSDDKRVGYEPRKDAVNLLTAHDSKGKEFPIVIIYAVQDFDRQDNLDESGDERRVLYVAMTRAKDTLFMLETDSFRKCSYVAELGNSVAYK